MLASTTVVSGEARAVVFATGMHTEFGKIAHLTQTTGETPSPLQREIARLSRLVAVLAAGLEADFSSSAKPSGCGSGTISCSPSVSSSPMPRKGCYRP